MDEKQKQKYMQLQMMQQQLEQLNKHLEQLTEQDAELDISISAMQELKSASTDNEFLAPIANGIFIKGELRDNQKLVVNVGSGVTVERTIPEVTVLLVKQKEELVQQKIQIEALLQEISTEAMKIYSELQGQEVVE
jgi:prefoldin alpha subunit